MSVEGFIRDGKGGPLRAHVHDLRVPGDHAGLLVMQERFLKFDPIFVPFLNATKGIAMNQNVSFTGQPTIMHAGVNSGSLLTGTTNGTTAFHLIDSTTNFTTGTIIVVGMSVKNTTSGNEFAIITAVANGDLTLDTDIFISGETYEINTIWVGTAVAGTWNFADSAQITLTGGNTGDEASFDTNAGQSWDPTNFTAMTGKVDLDTFDDASHTIQIAFGLGGTLVGNSVDLNDFIDVGDFAQQSFVIPKAQFGLDAPLPINDMTISLVRTGGPKPTFKLDDLQWENLGAPLVYTVTTPGNKRFHVTEIRIAIADDVTAVVTNGTALGLAFDALLGVSALTNGVIFSRTQDGEVTFAVSIKQLGDFLATGSNIVNSISDGTNTFITLLVQFPEPIILEPGSGNSLNFTINDDLSALSVFTAAARGAVEI